jgi:hypothetical protein
MNMREGHETFYSTKEIKLPTETLYLAKLCFRNKGEINIFSEKQKQREYIITRSVQKQILRRFFNLKDTQLMSEKNSCL